MGFVPAGTSHDPDLGRPIAALLKRCAEVLGVDLATICEAATNVEPYIGADGTEMRSLVQLERQLWHGAFGRRAATSSFDGPGRRVDR
jgi:hypothetical protein